MTLGPIGQAAASGAGLADLTPMVSDPDYQSDRLETSKQAMDGGHVRVRMRDVRAFEGAISNADRLSITFRFQAGTNELDGRAQADMDRLIAFLQRPPYKDKGVTVIGNSNLPATMPSDASKLYGKNVLNFLQLLFNKENQLVVDFKDDLVKGACMTHEGALNERLK